MRLSSSFSGALRTFAYFMSSGTHDMLEGVDYLSLYGEEPSAIEMVYAIFANVLELDETGNVLNAQYAQKRATDYLRSYCDSSFKVDPPYEDWETELQLKEKERRERAKVEEEVVIALAEVIDEYAREGSGWEKDFKRTVGAKGDEGRHTVHSVYSAARKPDMTCGTDPLPLAMLLASQCGHCIASERLQALPLPVCIPLTVIHGTHALNSV